MKYLVFSIFVLIFVSCNTNRNLEVTEMDLKADQFFYNGDYIAFTGICKVKYLSQNSIKLKSTYKNGILDGQTEMFYEDGKLFRKGRYVVGEYNGLWEGWFNNGNKEFEVNYKNGKLSGEYIAYYKNGKIKEKGEYLDNARINEWKIFDESGNEISRKEY